MNTDVKYMQRCIQLAKNGLGTTYPNPLVGSVIVHNEQIIGEGWHQKPGSAHAEVNAVNSVADRSLLPEATLYVNLEPCSHFGRTPPCSDMIIETGIKRVVVGSTDPNPIVAGRGIEKLKKAGISVTVGILNDDCAELNRRFFCYHTKKRPYIILKWAQSADGFIAPLTRSEQKPVWISNPYSRQLVHKWRSEEHAILVGTQTAIDDNPVLTARDWHGKNPIRIVIDRENRIPAESHIFDNQAKTILLSSQHRPGIDTRTIDFDSEACSSIVAGLYQEQLVSVIIEGGARTLQHFIDAGLWDEARIFHGKTKFSSGTKAPKFDAVLKTSRDIAGDKLLIYTK